MIGSVSTMNMDINKTTFYQSVDVASEITCNSLVVNGVNITGNNISSTSSTNSTSSTSSSSEIKPCFSCRPQGVQNYSNFSTINWGDILYNDTNGALNTATGTFTAPIQGLYEFNLRMLLNKTGFSVALRYTQYDTNVLTLALSYPKNLNTGYSTHNVSLVIPMKVGQYIYPTVEGSTTVQNNEKQWSSFSGIFIESI